MKKRILALILTVLMVMPMVLPAFAAGGEDYSKKTWPGAAEKVASMELMASSPDSNLLLYVDQSSGEMAIKNLTTGEIVFSNPYDISSSSLLNREKPYALSQIDLNFTVISSGETKTLHSYSDCYTSGQASISVLANGNGIRVDYMLGNQEQRMLVPNKIKANDLIALVESGLPKIIEEYEATLRVTYKDQLALGELSEEDFLAIVEKQATNFYEEYKNKILVGGYIAYFGQATKNFDFTTLVEKDKAGNDVPLLPESGYKYFNIYEENAKVCAKEYPICADVPIFVIQNPGPASQYIEDYLTKYTDYDFDQLDADYKEVEEKGIDDFSTSDRPKFLLTATYELTNTGLVATVDAGSLEYDTTKYKVNTISVLPYFNAAHASQKISNGGQSTTTVYDKGYTFIPDGSGALVRFEDLYADNNKQVKFENSMYGNDYAYYQVTTKNAANMTMPVFGLSNHTDKNGFVAVIEDADALAIVTSNHSTAYHSIYATFKLTPSDVYDLADSFSGGSSSSKKISINADNVYNGECKVNYMLLTDDEVAADNGISDYYENTYVGMATCYREYLEERGLLTKLTSKDINEDYVKLFLEVFGSIEVEEKIATFPVTVDKALTTFDDIKTIYNELFSPKNKEDKIGNISFILNGFANGGLVSDYPTSIEWQSVLGGDEGFKELLNYSEKNGFDVIPDVEFSYSYGAGFFSEYSHSEHGVRTLDNRYTTKRTYYAATQTFERTGGVAVSSASFGYLYEFFYKEMSQFDVTMLSVRSLGSDLNSDFDMEDYYDREASKDQVVEMLKLLKGADGKKSYSLVIGAGNSYAMPYADIVLAASLDSSRRSEMSESVPFFGIVYHGSVEFTGDAYNMEGDTEYALLKAIENGATLYFTIAKQNVELLKFKQEYNKYYSVSYENLKEDIISTYKVFNNAMKDVQDKYIVKHGFLDATRTEDGTSVDSSLIVMVEYEGGIGFVLNYSSSEVEVVMPNGKTTVIGALGFEKYTR